MEDLLDMDVLAFTVSFLFPLKAGVYFRIFENFVHLRKLLYTVRPKEGTLLPVRYPYMI